MKSVCRMRFLIVAFCFAATAISAVAQAPWQFFPVTPCRIVDTRNPDGSRGGPPIQGGTFRDFPIKGTQCTIPSTAVAYSMNVTAVPDGPLGYLTVWPTGLAQPGSSTLNSVDGRVKANAAIVAAGTVGDVSVFASNTTNVVLDINGYFAPPSGFSEEYFPLPPCRVVDTRNADGPLGGPSLVGQQQRNFPVQTAPGCNIPSGARAYSFNVTAIPMVPLGYLTVWAAGQPVPGSSTLNAPTGTVTANAAIVQAGTNGDVAVFPSNDTDLVIDIDGYFATPAQGGLSLYSLPAPCRAFDTRNGGGAFSGQQAIDIVNGPCQPPASAQAYVLNATVVPQGPLGYLTLWPDGEPIPNASTLNALDGLATSNMAIVSTTNGSIDAFASSTTDLVLDLSSYFAP